MLLDLNLLVIFADSMCKENVYAKMEKLEVQICRLHVQDRALKLCPALHVRLSAVAGSPSLNVSA